MENQCEPLRVLILEDRPADAELMVYELKQAGFEPEWQRVETERDYRELLQLGPDVILADHTLPEFDVAMALELLKKNGQDTPFIVVTGSISEEVAVERIKQGAADYILKDRMARLGPAVKAALEEKRLRDEKRQIEAALHARYQELHTLYGISQKVLRSQDLEETLEEILDRLLLIGGFDLGVIRILDRQDRGVVVHKGYLDPNNATGDYQNGKCTAAREELAQMMRARNAIVLEDLSQGTEMQALRMEGVRSAVIVPVCTEEQALGIIQLGSRTPRKSEKCLVPLLEAIGSQVGIAVQKARLYQELREQLAELEKSNRVKGEFLAVLSHELRTPLHVVIGYTGMILDGVLGDLSPEQKEDLKKAMRRTCNQLAVINSMLHATLIDPDAVRVERYKLDLVSFLDELRSDYDFPADEEVSLKWDYGSDLPPMKTDGTKLRIILKNLIDNAIKFTQKGSITVSARWLPGAERVTFEVADTGVGIAEKELAVILVRFRQMDNSESRVYGGVGLGLSIVKRFTELLGGTFQVESEPGKGSVFTVTLPL